MTIAFDAFLPQWNYVARPILPILPGFI
jgi:hypothetical protein